jgi:hypothetical protein
LGPHAFAIQWSIGNGLSPQHCQEYKALAHLDLCAHHHAAKKCRKLRMGAIQYSDVINQARGEIDLWERLQRKKDGIRASTKKI